MDIEKTLARAGASKAQIERYLAYQEQGNVKAQERILYRCRGMLLEKLQAEQRRLFCLDYLITKLEGEA